jgi:hypothetical protein
MMALPSIRRANLANTKVPLLYPGEIFSRLCDALCQNPSARSSPHLGILIKEKNRMIQYPISVLISLIIASFVGQSARTDKHTDPDIGNRSRLAQNTKPFNQDQSLIELRKQIADQKDKPAEEVFKNIQWLKGIPAGRVLAIMEIAYSKSLGVDCTHCHVVDQWEKDDKPTKQVTREMAMMVRTINNEHLKKIKNLKSENAVINCTTCHRGQIKPALNLP